MTYQPREGDHVRVVLEGRVQYVCQPEAHGDKQACYFDMGDDMSIYSKAPVVKSVERINPPEDWQPGDVVLDANERVFQRDYLRVDTWCGVGYEGEPARPLTLIARDGKAVTG